MNVPCWDMGMGNGSRDNEMNRNFRYDLIVCRKSYLHHEGYA